MPIKPFLYIEAHQTMQREEIYSNGQKLLAYTRNVLKMTYLPLFLLGTLSNKDYKNIKS